MKQPKPLLHFDFATHLGEIQPITFSNPIEIITATSLDEVVMSIEQVQEKVNEGKYAAGYISYEAAPAFCEHFTTHKAAQMPLVWFGIFDAPIRVGKSLTGTHPFTTQPWQPSVRMHDYNKHMDQIHNYIAAKKTEQVNYTIRIKSEFSGDPITFYNQLQKGQAAKYTAYLNVDNYSILSASPELFFQLHNKNIITKPMAGTVARGKTFEEDDAHAKWLERSSKNRNENEQIVQLMKQDLAKIAKPGTIRVPKRYEIEKYPTIYQMTSTVTAELLPDKDFIHIFKTLFPSGSITGLPKAETMTIIAELEQEPRNVYSGTIGYITPKGNAMFNIPIRTVTIDHRNGKAVYGAGSGITSDSNKSEEYGEVLAKAKVLQTKQPEFKLLETIGLFNGQLYLLEEHLDRLEQSSAYFDYTFHRDTVKKRLVAFAEKNPTDDYRVRLLMDKDGNCTVEGIKIHTTDSTDRRTVALSTQPIDQENIFLYHKTNFRDMYQEHKQNHSDVFDVLLWNENYEVTEFTTGNLVVEIGKELFTPPVKSGLLAGTFREVLLREGKVKERTIRIDELKKCTNMWFINSVRKWIAVDLEMKSND